ncbi:MAG TPA: hypothetical protein VJ372_11110 [Pyrinomonadaceae bacterium]|jgi:hypothetical protein|nr:hypothetical protein [Pyrinomonadaceae bacterium]
MKQRLVFKLRFNWRRSTSRLPKEQTAKRVVRFWLVQPKQELLSELDQLLAQRAGLQARWRDLEDEARRSGAYPGWLR